MKKFWKWLTTTWDGGYWTGVVVAIIGTIIATLLFYK